MARLGLAEALLATNRADDAVHVAASLGKSRDSRIQLEAALVRLHALSVAIRWEDLTTFVRIATDGESGDDVLANDPRFLAEAALALLSIDDERGGTALAARALALGDDASVEARVVATTTMALADIVFRGDVRAGRAGLELATALAKEDGMAATLRRAPYAFLSQAQRWGDRLDASVATARQGIAVAERLGWPRELSHLHNALAQALAAQGNFDEALAEWEAGLAAIEDGATPVSLAYIHTRLGVIAVHRDDLAEAGRRVAEIRAMRETTLPDQGSVDWLEALLAEASNDGERACQLASQAAEVALATGMRLNVLIPAPDLTRLLVAGGRRELAGRVAAAATDVSDGSGSDWIQGTAARVRGMVDSDVDQLRAAVVHFERAGTPWDLACAREELGILLVRVGSSADARPHIEAALQSYVTLGMSRDARRAAALGRTVGIRKGSRQPQRLATHGWESVTSAEHRVLALAVEGLTSREIGERLFLSPRTVESHLARLFRKIGVRNRSELVADALRRAATSGVP
jgi:DNA-binding CsgD family transcriptional regulator/tetratricopeptide (TPR) repeat protein